jgi:hypothetical protein
MEQHRRVRETEETTCGSFGWSVLDSGLYVQPCISLLDYCVERDLDMEEVLEILHRSDISFGLNDDTLVREERLCRLLGIEPPEHERYMISLGC